MIPMLVNKLAQDPTRRLISVNWGTKGGLLILWAFWNTGREFFAPKGIAAVSGMPTGWAAFDMFDNDPDKVDLTDPDFKKLPLGHSEPISDTVLQKYYQWAIHPSYNLSSTGQVVGQTLYYATYGPTVTSQNYNSDGGGVDQCGKELTLIETFGAAFPNCQFQVINYVAQHAKPGTFNPGEGVSLSQDACQGFCDGMNIWFRDFKWGIQVHVESVQIVDPKIFNNRQNSAVMAINLAKLRKLQPVNPKTGKKDDTYTFRVTANGDGGDGFWQLKGQVVSTVLPPKGNGMRSFPLEDSSFTEFNGESFGTLQPAWDSWLTATGGGGGGSSGVENAENAFFSKPVGASVDVTVDLVKQTVSFKKFPS